MKFTKNSDYSITAIIEEQDLEILYNIKEVDKLIKEYSVIERKIQALQGIVIGKIQMNMVESGLNDRLNVFQYNNDNGSLVINPQINNPFKDIFRIL